MTVVYPNQSYNEVCYKGTAMYLTLEDNITFSKILVNNLNNLSYGPRCENI